MKREPLEIVSLIGTIVFLLAIVLISVMALIKAKQGAETSKVYQIDTTKVDVLYENTWGKIILVKEEDL